MPLGKLCPVARVAALALTLVAARPSAAQAMRGASEYPDSKVDIYGGYGWFHPLNSGIYGQQYQDITNPNATASVSYWFNHFLGVQMEGSYFSGNGEHRIYDPSCSKSMCDQLIYTAEAGPVLRLPMGAFVPFIHALGGGERTNGPVDQHLFWGWGVTGGAGVDYVLPFWSKRLAVRPIQADFQYSQVVYGPLVLPAAKVGGFGEIDALKLSGGLTFRFGETSNPPKLAFGCTAEPISVFAGEPVTVSGSTLGLSPKRKPVFTWAANGGKLTPHGEEATIDTTGLAPGEYTVAGHVSQGLKAYQQADCNVPFTVKPVLPPTITCAANPATAVSGTTIDISTTATSPSNRPLTYSYASTAGQVTGTGATAKLTTAGLDASNITVTCNVADDMGQRASAQTTVTVSKPEVPVIPDTQRLCSISFTRDHRRPARVDNEAKACLDDVALTLTQQADAHIEMIGNASPDENPTAAAERALNARQYLTKEKGIDPSRIEVRVGQTSGRTLDNILVPSGASYSDPNTALFNEHAITRHGEAYGIHHGSAAPILHTAHPPARRTRHTHTHAAAPSAVEPAPAQPATAPLEGTSEPAASSTAPHTTHRRRPATAAPAPTPGAPATSIPPLQ